MLWSTGLDGDGQLGRESRAADVAFGSVRLPSGPAVVAVAAGGRHSLAVRKDGTVLSWGADDAGQLGRTGSGRTPAPVAAPDGASGVLDAVVAVAADTDFSMALRADGTVVTWGKGDAGQRGVGTTQPFAGPTVVRGPDGQGPLTGVVEIAADGRTELALLKDGTVMAWGANRYGMLGDGTTADRSLPVPVTAITGNGPLRGVRHIAVGGQHGAALLGTGEVLTWGRNDAGQLGDGTTIDRSLPGGVRGPDGEQTLTGVVAISAAEKHMFALRSDGTVVAWGNNTGGQLGDGTTEPRSMPVSVVDSGTGSALRGVRQVAAGEAYGVAVLEDGTVRTWGANGSGQLGAGDRVPRRRPGPVIAAGGARVEKVAAVAAGERHLILLTATG